MPDLDGFETANLISSASGRGTSDHLSDRDLEDAEHVFRGYSAGAVDYLFKPFDPVVLRSKVAVFIELWQKTDAIGGATRSWRSRSSPPSSARANCGTARSQTRCRRSCGLPAPTEWSTTGTSAGMS